MPAAERDDLVAEAFTLVLRALRTGCGPTTDFRPYLLVTMRNVMISSYHRRAGTVLCDEVPERLLAEDAADDPVGTRIAAGVAADALMRLPERWRMVLWRTEVAGESPAELGPQLGLTPNGVAALACRAREGLRQAYLAMHLPARQRSGCQATRTQLVAWVRRQGTQRPASQRVSAHLTGCAECRAVAARLARINRGLGAVIDPIVILGAPIIGPSLTAGAGAAFGTASVASTGITSASWLTTVKTVLAGTVLTAATALTATASDPTMTPKTSPALPRLADQPMHTAVSALPPTSLAEPPAPSGAAPRADHRAGASGISIQGTTGAGKQAKTKTNNQADTPRPPSNPQHPANGTDRPATTPVATKDRPATGTTGVIAGRSRDSRTPNGHP